MHDYSLFTPYVNFISYFSINIEWAYNTVYFIFAFSFVNLKSYSKKWSRFVFWGVIVLFSLNIGIEITAQFGNSEQVYDATYYFMSFVLTLFALVCYIPLLKAEGFLKYYIVIGSATFLFFSILALIESRFHFFSSNESMLFVFIFYIGVVLENMLFSLGLGHKQRVILQEKNRADKELIVQLKQNEELRNEIQLQLETDLETLSKKAEEAKIKNLKTKYEKELAELKLSSLRSQMNPHFIFNSLNSIKRYIIDSEKENAVFYLNKFSKLIRKILASTASREISLLEELETMKLYVKIENIRFNNAIDLKLNVDTSLNLNTIKIPSLITQPFIENAIWHGLSLKEDDKKLSIHISKENDLQLRIEIIDNGIGRVKARKLKEKKLHKRTSFGIKLSEERLIHFSNDYEGNYSLKFTDIYKDDKPAGTNVTILIPTK
ncbi:histidine kinase [Marinirhabdus gelatinilytica]|uniref:Histidine kinase n=1 Tax=Marinirhabdus gelatinilytica TaxID=1703343 RepID=A0A370QF19_9FLAO|nr:histidine kinase [Marinirhabdus gelatinilytica]